MMLSIGSCFIGCDLIKKVSIEGEYTTVNEYSYNELGNLVKEVETFADSAPYIYEYKYKLVYIPFDLSEKVIDILTCQ